MGLLHLLVLHAAYPDLAVVVIDPLPERRELATALGAQRAVSPGTEAGEAVAQTSRGLGADAVFDTVGGRDALDTALSLSRQGGSVVLFAHAPEAESAGFHLNTLFKLERRLIGTYSGGLREQATVFGWMLEGRLDPSPLVSHRLPLDQFAVGVNFCRQQLALKVLYHSVESTTP